MSRPYNADVFRKELIPDGIVVYGSPTSRRGRFVNRVRRLFGREERMQIYWSGPSMWDTDTITIKWDTSGLFTLDGDPPPE